jgi:hypothetical protein
MLQSRHAVKIMYFTAQQSVESTKAICLLRSKRTESTAYHRTGSYRLAGQGRDWLGIDMHPQFAKGCGGTRAPLGLKPWRRRSNSVLTHRTPRSDVHWRQRVKAQLFKMYALERLAASLAKATPGKRRPAQNAFMAIGVSRQSHQKHGS